MATDLMKLVQSVLAQKRALDARERELVDSLNRVLPDMGYRVVSTSDTASLGPRLRTRSPRAVRRDGATGPKNLVCSECGRRFAHPLHLGRHTAATHKGAGAKPAAMKASASRNGATAEKATRRGRSRRKARKAR